MPNGYQIFSVIPPQIDRFAKVLVQDVDGEDVKSASLFLGLANGLAAYPLKLSLNAFWGSVNSI